MSAKKARETNDEISPRGYKGTNLMYDNLLSSFSVSTNLRVLGCHVPTAR